MFVKFFNRNTDKYIVQSDHMVDEIVGSGLKKKEDCICFPFYKLADFKGLPFEQRKIDFVYISTASFYKNHTTLLDAWDLLFEKGLSPTLHLTVSKDATKTYQYILKLREKGLNIVNHGYTDPGPLYSSCAYLVYPSLNESFGLSLVEAAASGMKILAVDLPYVNSVIRPSASFHPERTASLSGIVFYAMKNAVPFPEILIRDQVDDLIRYLLT
jgi:glycosyltransferase involved in cell wall biosynthesis